MAVLSKREILSRVESGSIRFHPEVDPSNFDYVSVDLRLGRKFSLLREETPKHIPAVRVDPSLYNDPQYWTHFEQDRFRLERGRLVIAYTLEEVSVPLDLVGFVEGRSRWARAGVSVHVTAPKIDPGFEGAIALEMVNLSPWTIELVAVEDTPAQLIFMEISSPVVQGYGSSERDIFQYQKDPIPR